MVEGSPSESARRRDLPMGEVLALQRTACERAGSTLYARILDVVADDVAAGGLCHEILDPWSANAMADAVPLRFLAAVHAIVLAGGAPSLARLFPSAGGADTVDDEGLRAEFLTAVAAHRAEIDAAMPLGVQTNEVGRAASLVGAFHLVGARSGLPLRTLEVGSSAGLLLRWDRFGYVHRAGTPEERRWGGDELVFEDPWVVEDRPDDGAPAFVDELTVAERRGCDIAPIDVTTDAGVARLRSFLWPDQIERRARLDAAIRIARAVPATVDAGDAGEWVERQLAAPTPGVATVVHHSIVLQYLPRQSFRRMRAAIEAAGARATPDAPVHWLRMEPAGEVADVRLRTWSGSDPTGDDELLATTGYHGPPVSWLGPTP